AEDQVVARIDSRDIPETGEDLELAFDTTKAHFFEKAAEEKLIV
ncbi:MAG: sugar ABC transporter ATP-binding protein, partial [Rhizobacter sp.]|nr:sugar ABC transporter ATP-binding protein [Chlorobiales bacterium]